MSSETEYLPASKKLFDPENILLPEEFNLSVNHRVNESLRAASQNAFEKMHEMVSQRSPEADVSLVEDKIITKVMTEEPLSWPSNSDKINRYNTQFECEKVSTTDGKSDLNLRLVVNVLKENEQQVSMYRVINFFPNPNNPEEILITSDIANLGIDDHIATPLVLSDHYFKRTTLLF